jgi:hypothetical protein
MRPAFCRAKSASAAQLVVLRQFRKSIVRHVGCDDGIAIGDEPFDEKGTHASGGTGNQDNAVGVHNKSPDQ